MTMLDPKQPYFLRVQWKDGEDKEQVCETKVAAKLLYELEMRKGIKGKFTLEA